MTFWSHDFAVVAAGFFLLAHSFLSVLCLFIIPSKMERERQHLQALKSELQSSFWRLYYCKSGKLLGKSYPLLPFSNEVKDQELAGETAWSGKGLPHKCKDSNINPQHPD